MRGVILHCEQ